MFAHTVRVPLFLLYDKWLSNHKQQNLCDYVSTFRFRLHRACQLAKQNLSAAQSKMKTWYDKGTKTRTFKPGDKVLILLPVLGSVLQAWFSGPYNVLEKVSDRDYIVATSNRRRRTRLCHVDMIKLYFDGNADPPTPAETEKKTVLALSGAELPEMAVGDSDGIDVPSSEVVQGSLKNSQVLSQLDTYFNDLDGAQRRDIVGLILSNMELFSDVPTRTNLQSNQINQTTRL